MSKSMLVLAGLAAAGYYAHQQGMLGGDQALLEHRNANATAAAFRSADQDDALKRYESGLCTPYVAPAEDQSGLPPGYVRVTDLNLPPEGAPAVDHNQQSFPNGTVLCNKSGQTGIVEGGRMTDIKHAGSSPEVVAYIHRWFEMTAERQ